MTDRRLPKLVATWRTPDGKASPVPPETYRNGEAKRKPAAEAKPEVVDQQQVASTQEDEQAELLHHQPPPPGEASPRPDRDPPADAPHDASPSAATDWDDVAAFVAEATQAGAMPTSGPVVVNQPPAVNSGRNQPLTHSEEDRLLLCLSYGMSLRQRFISRLRREARVEPRACFTARFPLGRG